MTSGNTVHPARAEDVTAWDDEADVVIVGYGCAGAAAAVEATAAGASVLILEGTAGAGGASAMAGGAIYLGGGTSLQRACGFDDTPEDMFRFVMAAVGAAADENKVRIYCERSVEHFDWLVDLGVPFKASLYTGLFPEPTTDDGLMWTGGEDTHPWNEVAHPAPRGHLPRMADKRPGERSAGWVLMRHLTERAEGSGARVRYDTAVDRLVVDRDDRVAGVVARQYGAAVTVRARRGVVLAAGGFIFNDDMLAQHAPHLLGLGKLGTGGDDGRAIRMAQAVGAGVCHMGAAEAAYGMPELLCPSLLVNRVGQRFINEDTYFGRVGQAVMFHQGGRAFVVLDDEIHESMSEIGRMYRPNWVCETVGELGHEMGLPDGALEATVELYNRHAERGEDPLFGKRPRWLKPLRSPFGAVDLGRGAFASFTLGGLHTTVDGEVMHVAGDPLPGLYAAGRTTSGIPAWGYCSGMSLGDGTFFGRRAGRAAAGAS